MTAMQIFDAQATVRLTPFPQLIDALRSACVEYARGAIASPARLVVPLNDGGVMLSMPATAGDLAIHKLVTVCPRNGERGLPTIHGQVTACDADTGEALFALDGPTVTGRRTAAVSMLAIRTLMGTAPRDVLLIGAGTQGAHHARALGEVFPQAKIRVRGSSYARAQAFCAAYGSAAPNLEPIDGVEIPDSVDVVVTVTTSKVAVYDEAPRRERLVVGVGAFTPDAVEIGARTVLGSTLLVDDLAGARHEAGDFIQAGVDWARVATLASVLGDDASAAPRTVPVVFKSVGCAAWDLAACRVARGLAS
ncbi:delta(1)-pyrroline-2-carboxylate reductase family protein [Trinickia terrae]|uniref:Delta(1)-pyrroline-2-carboxylate reductase family protein n=1 Tax=Trinickia terrae TaxID=2571161 RepID=A0A4U1IFX2_9BURK|nr:bifunctional Delta(1)-pyrroline-2-carboxylate/Delta(1)-piperideine-2-carboxylate reductase [Trinickia terrae]TKC92654.1 delta(1)-pyrroline-2-carboxylate reductase family protein [Trinickia terrae]